MYAVPRGDGLYGRLALVHDARMRKVEMDAKPVDVARSRRDAAVAQVQAEQVAVLGWELVERVLGMAADRAVRRRRAGMPGQSAGEPVPDGADRQSRASRNPPGPQTLAAELEYGRDLSNAPHAARRRVARLEGASGTGADRRGSDRPQRAAIGPPVGRRADTARRGSAAERIRTSTGLRPMAPEAIAYASFATAA